MKKQKKEAKKKEVSKKSAPLKKDTLNELEGGIRVALSRGQELKSVMMSYYNAGYKKEDIQEAAKRAQQKEIKVVKESEEPKEKTKEEEKGSEKENKEKEKIKKKKEKKPKEKKQKVSKYEGDKNKKIIIAIIILLVIVVGGGITYLFTSGII